MSSNDRIDGIVKWPAMCLIGVGVLGFLFQIASFVAAGPMQDHLIKLLEESGTPMDPEMFDPTNPWNLMGTVIGFILAIGTIVGGWAMLQRSSWALALTGSICAILPCLGCCCLSTPFGVWALIVLLKPEVKQAMGAS